jgi:hypothetical protein
VYDAVTAVRGDYQPYAVKIRAHGRTSSAAAVAAAAHAVLSADVPVARASVDDQYALSLSGIPEGAAKDRGVALGGEVGRDIVASRVGDGRNAGLTYTPAPGPGVWRPTPPAFAPAQTPWLALMHPFLIDSAAQFRPGPPPALSGTQWAAEFNEVKLMGRATSTTRTPEQTDVAKFWSGNANIMYNNAFQALAIQNRLGAEQTARLLAMGDLVGTDALIACFDSKYTYGFWRPVTAIQNADTDDNPATIADPSWTPLLVTPNHPEYAAAHGCLTGAEAQVLAYFFSSPSFSVDISSPVTGTTRHYGTVEDLDREIVNARVWGGLHYRGSVEAGIEIGNQVADWSLQRYFQPR